MDYTTAAATNFEFVGKLATLADTHPIGVASAFSALHERLVEVVSRLGGDLGEELVAKVAGIRARVGLSVGEDYQAALREYRLKQDTEYFEQRGYVATQLLGSLKPEPFKADNDLTKDQLEWIIPSLNEAGHVIDKAKNPAQASGYAPEIKEACALKLALDGLPEEKAELKFLEIHEILFARIMDYVPSAALLGYWQSLTPVTETGKEYHAMIEDYIIGMAPEDIKETDYLESGLVMLDCLSETVCAAARDWETRALSQQTTEYIRNAANEAYDRIQVVLNNSRNPEALEEWAQRCEGIIGRIKMLPQHVPNDICKHFELSADELSAYSENFDDNYAQATLMALTRC